MIARVRAGPLVNGLDVALQVVVIQEIPAAGGAGMFPPTAGAGTTTAATQRPLPLHSRRLQQRRRRRSVVEEGVCGRRPRNGLERNACCGGFFGEQRSVLSGLGLPAGRAADGDREAGFAAGMGEGVPLELVLRRERF